MERPEHLEASVDEVLRREHATVHGGEPVDDGLDAWVGGVAEPPGDEVDAVYEGSGVDPLDALVPALDGGRIEEALAHEEGLVGDVVDFEGGLSAHARESEGSDDQLDRPLDTREALPFSDLK